MEDNKKIKEEELKDVTGGEISIKPRGRIEEGMQHIGSETQFIADSQFSPLETEAEMVGNLVADIPHRSN